MGFHVFGKVCVRVQRLRFKLLVFRVWGLRLPVDGLGQNSAGP